MSTDPLWPRGKLVSRPLARLALSIGVAASILAATAMMPAMAAVTEPTAPTATTDGEEIVQVALTLTGSAAPAIAFAQAKGLHVDLVTRHAVLLSGPATKAAGAFGARLHRVRAHGNPSGAARYLAPAAVPTVPVALRDAVGAVIGLDNRPLFEHRAVPNGYTGSDLSTAYAAGGLSGGGAGITVATVQFDAWYPSDATTYASAAGIPLGARQITTVPLPGSNSLPDGSGGDQEVALDVEALLATAPKAAQRVYVAPNTAAGAIAVYNKIADEVAAGQIQVVSTSWGRCEASYPAQLLPQLAAPIDRLVGSGGTIFAASGDNGAYDCAAAAHPDGRLAVDFPASLPSVVAVGGTRLTRGGGVYAETGWGQAPTTTADATYAGVGSGGGTSAVFARPAYQSSVNASGAGRAVPDVSALADASSGFGAYSTSAGGWRSFGGTSLGAPMWAGHLASALSTDGRSSGIGDIHAALYAAPSAFRDITSGANGHYSAAPGYDQVTGLGSPQWTALYTALGLSPLVTGPPIPVGAGGTVSSAEGEPVVATVTSPVAGTVSFTPLVSPGAPARTAALPLGIRITGPDAPLSMTFTVNRSQLPAGAFPQDVRVVYNGTLVPRCLVAAVQCTSAATRTADALVYTITGARAGSWTFAVDRVARLAGADRVGTAVAISKAAFADGSAPAAVLARSDAYADALAGAPLAAVRKGPLLLTGSAALAPADAVELTRAVAPGGTVYLLGGPGALGSRVADQVSALGFTVARLAGRDRFATATAIAMALDPAGPILLTTGLSFPDALAAGAAAAHIGAAVLLTAGNTPAPATQVFLAAHPNATLYAVGGPAAQAYPSAIPVVGSNRYATAVAVARRFFPGARAAGLASGVSFPDALAAGPVLGASGVPLLLTGSAPLATSTTSHLTTSNPVTVHVFGGSAVLSSGLVDAVWKTLG